MYQMFPLAEIPQRHRFDHFSGLVDEMFCPMQCEPESGK
jgi:hypothetical protein